MNKKEAFGILFRYLLLIIIAFPNLFLFYFIFTPLTVYSSYIILDVLYNADLYFNIITIEGLSIEIISACVAGAAYYLLLILNLSTPMQLKKRIKSFIFLIFSFFALNIIRIVIFSILALNGFKYFDLAHAFLWYAGSTLLLVAIWFANIYIFKIKEIPVYSDLKRIIKDISYKSMR